MKPFGRHFIFLASLGVGLVALAVATLLQHPLSYSIAANAFFATYIFLVLREMPRLTADFLSRAPNKPTSLSGSSFSSRSASSWWLSARCSC